MTNKYKLFHNKIEKKILSIRCIITIAGLIQII
jgi:hypothetical protein